MELNKIISEHRTSNGATQESTAKFIQKAGKIYGQGCTPQTIRNWESGRTKPDFFFMFWLGMQTDIPVWVQRMAQDYAGRFTLSVNTPEPTRCPRPPRRGESEGGG